MTAVLRQLPVVVIYPHARCNCRCAMCDIWRRTAHEEISPEDFARYLEEFAALSVEWIVFSGGEPLMHSGLEVLCRMCRERGIRTTILSTGLLLERHAHWIGSFADEVIVSLDGPREVHDRIRGVPGAFDAMAQGVRALHRLDTEFPVAARCTVQKLNHHVLLRTAETARGMGLRSISFLAADLASDAFDHAPVEHESRQAALGLTELEVDILQRELALLDTGFPVREFIRETPAKLRRIADHFRASLAQGVSSSPQCNAPWVSAVLETDGTVRPCFFHPPVGRASPGRFSVVLNGPSAQAFRSSLDVATNPICRGCVCSLNWQGSVAKAANPVR